MRSAFLALTNFGCQYQFGWWLIGIEGDGAVTNKDGQAFNFFPGTFFAGDVEAGLPRGIATLGPPSHELFWGAAVVSTQGRSSGSECSARMGRPVSGS